MFVLNPAHKELFEFQLKHVFFNIWLSEFCSLANANEWSTSEIRRSRFGLRGNRFLNFIATLYGYKSYSALLANANSSSEDSPWISDHEAFFDDGTLYERTLFGVSIRGNSTLVGYQELLAKSFLEAAHQIYKSKSPYEVRNVGLYKGYDTLILLNWIMELSFVDGYISVDRKDEIDPVFVPIKYDDGECDYDVVEDDSPCYVLMFEEGAMTSISPIFSNLIDANNFFKKNFGLYCKYIFDIYPDCDSSVFEKVGNMSGVIFDSTMN